MTKRLRKDDQSRSCGCCGCGGCPGCLLVLGLILLMAVILWQTHKPLPEGLSMKGEPCNVPSSDISLLADLTSVDSTGQRLVEQYIFDRMVARISDATEFILLDNFFFNTITGAGNPPHRKLCEELTQALISAKKRQPEMPVVVITDPINTVYGGHSPPHLEALKKAGIRVVVTDLKKLRDSNAVYSALWRVGPSWFGNPGSGGILPNPFTSEGPQVGIRSWLSLLNFKANHRKVLLSDDGHGRWGVIVGSLNAHNGSSMHSNLALEITSNPLALQVWRSEAAVLGLSGVNIDFPPIPTVPSLTIDASNQVSLVTEAAILDAILDGLADAREGTKVEGAYFYLSHRKIQRALIEAAQRGAEIRLILDPSKDAFGRTKTGIPNRQAARNLMTKGKGRITVRWYNTHGEQFHPKMIAIRSAAKSTIILGSANLTRRNLDDFNLESNLVVQCPPDAPTDTALRIWFERLWLNQGVNATVDYEVFHDPSLFKRVIASFQERTGMGTF